MTTDSQTSVNTTLNTEVNLQVEGEVNLTDQLMTLVTDLFNVNSLAFQITISILATLVAIQFVKIVVKHYVNTYRPQTDKMLRKIVLTSLSLYAGYSITLAVLQPGVTPNPELVAKGVGLFNPVVFVLLSFLVDSMASREGNWQRFWIRVYAMLKGRKTKENEDGTLSVEDTVIFMKK